MTWISYDFHLTYSQPLAGVVLGRIISVIVTKGKEMTFKQIIERHIKEMKVWYIIAIIMFAIGAASESKANYIVPILTSVETDTLYTTATSYDGVNRDVSRFYERSTPSLGINTVFSYNGISGNVSLNTGTRTEKLSISPSLSGSIGKSWELDSGWSLSGNVGWSLSGSSKHTSCTDSYDREYYCGDLTAWSEFDNKSTKSKFEFNSIQVNFVKEF